MAGRDKKKYFTERDGKIWLDKEHVLEQTAGYWRLRRAQDIVLSAIVLVVFLPVLLLIAAAIVIDDPGNPFFLQERCGRDGRRFAMLKFRSMYMGAEDRQDELLGTNEMDGPVFKIKDDPRITRVGKFIRKTSLDELPQFWNVLCGHMSIVGPRPALPREVEQYTDYQRQRLYVTPGLTCYWQIHADRYEMSFDDWVGLDLKYICDRGFLTDWKIIILTLRSVVMGHGE